MFGWTDCICFRQGHWLQSVKCYLYVSPTTYWSGESHLAIWSPETACQTAVISWCSGQNFRSLSVEASKMKPFLYVCLLRRSATVVDWNWQYLLLWMLCMIHTIEGPLTRAKRRVCHGKANLDLGTDAVCRNWFRENDFPHEIHLHKVIACHQVPMKIHCWESALIAIKRSYDFC